MPESVYNKLQSQEDDMELCGACGDDEATVENETLGKICGTCNDLLGSDLEADRFASFDEPLDLQAEIDAEPDLDFDEN